MILENRWFEIQKESMKSEKEINIDELKIFSRIKDSLAVNDTGHLILRENRIVLPSIHRNLAVNLAHTGHLGLTKTKALLRSKAFFPNMDKITRQVLGLCTFCKSVTPSHDRHKLISQPTPLETLDTINLDFLGPFPNGQYIFVMIDQRRKYLDVEFTRSTSARNVIFVLERFFRSAYQIT